MDASENELACRLDSHVAHKPLANTGSSHKRQTDEPKYCEMVAFLAFPFSFTKEDAAATRGRFWYLPTYKDILIKSHSLAVKQGNLP